MKAGSFLKRESVLTRRHSMSKKNDNIKTNRVLAALEHYNDTIGQEALSRAGCNQQLKGIVHEMLFRDKCNMNPSSILKGNVTVLTKNPTAHNVDLVTMNEGKAVAKYQLKDCTSDSGIRDTLGRVRKGQYRNTQLMGTEETTKKYNSMKSPNDRPMKSTGVSSKRTGRIADNAGVKSPDKNTVMNNFKDIGSCAMNSAGIGAAFSAAGSIYSNLEKYNNGEIDGVEYMGEVAKDTAKGAVKSATTTATALSLKEGGKALGDAVGSQALRKFAGSNAGTAVAFGIAEIGYNAFKYANGDIDGKDFAKSSATTVGGAAGGYGGAVAGAAIGSAVLPGVGTAIGACLGGIVVGVASSSVVESICDTVCDWFDF